VRDRVCGTILYAGATELPLVSRGQTIILTSDKQSKRRGVVIVGCGYVGQALGEALVAAGYDVVGTTTSPERVAELAASGITPQVLDVRDAERLSDLFRGADAVFATVAAGRNGDYQRTYAEGLDHIAEACRTAGAGRLVYTSSTRVYAQDDGSRVDESAPTIPADANGAALLAAEQAVLGREGDLCGTVVRLGGIYGPGRDLTQRIRLVAGTRRSDGRHVVNLIHRDDIVSALSKLLQHPYHGVLNLVDDNPTPRRALYDGVLHKLRLKPIAWDDPPDDQPGGLGKCVANDLIKRTLALSLVHPAFAPSA